MRGEAGEGAWEDREKGEGGVEGEGRQARQGARKDRVKGGGVFERVGGGGRGR